MNSHTPKPLPSRVAARNYSSQVAPIARHLAAFGLSVAEGTPTNTRRIVLIHGESHGEPVLLVRTALDGEPDADGHPRLTPAMRLFAAALARRGGSSGIDLRVLCAPRDGEEPAAAIDAVVRDADLELRLAIESADLQPEQTRMRKLRIRLTPRPRGRRAAVRLERHPFLYSLAIFREFSFKHPLFGQILCGGSCGVSGAWQFTCTMAKTFVSKRHIERNLFERAVFATVRNHPNSLMTSTWTVWEWTLRRLLWGPIALRKAVVQVAKRLPWNWFSKPGGVLRLTATTLVNHLECPKSLRNGACGAPSPEGLCGELQKYGIRKPCVFHYRNARDLHGERLGLRLTATATRFRASPFGRPIAPLMEIMAAIVSRRPLPMRIYPRVDTRVFGASAIVNAMGGRFKGMTLFGTRALLPNSVARSEIGVIGLSPRGHLVLSEARHTVGRLPHRVSEGVTAVTMILNALAHEGHTPAHAQDVRDAAASSYERVRAYQMNHTPDERPLFRHSGMSIGEPRHGRR
ncbi:MAG: hypothetical protein ACREQN_06365 [Candidatus Binataceae bacterium]